MPYKDPEKKAPYQKAWRERSHTPAYMKWLYARRKLTRDKAAHYEATLELIFSGKKLAGGQQQAAGNVLELMHDYEREVGNRFDHENDKPYYKED